MGCVATHLQKGIVGVRNPAVRGEEEHPNGINLERPPQTLFVFTQFTLSVLAPGDIDESSDHARNPVFGGPIRRDSYQEPSALLLVYRHFALVNRDFTF